MLVGLACWRRRRPIRYGPLLALLGLAAVPVAERLWAAPRATRPRGGAGRAPVRRGRPARCPGGHRRARLPRLHGLPPRCLPERAAAFRDGPLARRRVRPGRAAVLRPRAAVAAGPAGRRRRAARELRAALPVQPARARNGAGRRRRSGLRRGRADAGRDRRARRPVPPPAAGGGPPPT